MEDDRDDRDNSTTETEDVPDISKVKFTRKETYYFKQADRFFKKLETEKIDKMIDIISGESKISLRSLDWFVTIYAGNHKIRYGGEGKGNNVDDDEGFNVYIGYKAQLKSFRKRYFDPFRRRQKFIYRITRPKENYDRELCTTIGQLNFFRWAFTNNLISYVEDNYQSIIDMMGKSNKEKKTSTQKEDKDDGVKVIKEGVKVRAKQKVNDKNREVKIIVSFDD